MAEETVKKDKKGKVEYIFATGRRRGAVARVRMYTAPKASEFWGELEAKKGDILVNQKPVADYFHSAIAKVAFMQPFRITNTENKFVTMVKVAGGGMSGQLDATVHGISRAIALLDREKNRGILKKKGLLSRDQRVRERRKVGTGGKARRKKQSPKR